MSASPLDSEFREGVTHVAAETDGIVAACLEGEFDLANAEALAERLSRALTDATGLIVDLNQATFIDSTVIHVLVRTVRAAAQQEKSVVLQLANGAIVEHAIEVVGVERILPRAHDRREAVRIIQQNAAEAGSRLGTFTYVNAGIFEAATQSIAQGATWDFFCECGDPDCSERITLTRDGYEQLRDAGRSILATGHRVDEWQ